MSLFNSRTFTVRRTIAGSYVKGKWVEGTSSTFTIKGTFQPGSVERMQTVLEGKRIQGAGDLITSSTLQLANPATQTSSDWVEIDGIWWEVVQVGHWKNGLIPHSEYVVVWPKEGTE
jgi:hypothetical protein